MNVLLIGGGGREHALAWKISQSPLLSKLFAAPGNPGIFSCAEKAALNPSAHDEVISFCREQRIDLIVIGPEQYLEEGLSDALRDAGFHVFGPSKKAAQLETSKGFAKDFMARHSIPTAKYQRFNASQRTEAWRYLAAQDFPVVIKADGLAAGKGVTVATDNDEAFGALDAILNGEFGTAGAEVVIEEFLHGEEASVFAICDGRGFVTLAPAQDHKRVRDNDEGKNTGGMGSYAPAPLVSEAVMDRVREKIIAPVLKGMADEGMPFTGCLFVGLMIHNGEPSVVEFNARFGDPETQSVLSVLEGDFLALLASAAQGEINPSVITNVAKGFACTVVLASEGYPDTFEKNFPISGIETVPGNEGRVFHAGTKQEGDTILTNGGRVLGISSKAESLAEAIGKAYESVRKISYKNIYYRTDIGRKGLKDLV